MNSHYHSGCKRPGIAGTIVVVLMLIFLTLAAYAQVSKFDFLNFDDPTFTTGNPAIRKGFTIDGVQEVFSNTDYLCMQMAFLSHMLDCHLFGLNPGPHHTMNLLWHLINAVMIFFLLFRMTGEKWQSVAVASLFAIHPINAESVAWIAERRNVLSTFFWLLTLWAYLKYVENTNYRWYLFVMVFFGLGLMSKAMLVTLPFTLLLLDFWPLKRVKTYARIKDYGIGINHQKKNPESETHHIDTDPPLDRKSLPPNPALSFLKANRHLVAEKAPLFIIMIIAVGMTLISAQNTGGVRGIGGLVSIDAIPMTQRIANSLVSYVNYLLKMAWPFHLSVYYAFPWSIPAWKVVGASLFLVLTTWMALKNATKQPWFIVGWLWYLGTLVPVIGIVQLGGQALADRYAYIPFIGIFIILAWGVPEIWPAGAKKRLIVAGSVALSALVLTTWLYVRHWENSLTFFTYTVKVSPDYAVAHNNLGMALAEKGDLDRARSHLIEAINLHPGFDAAYNNLGNVLAELGQTDAAITNYLEAIRVNAAYAEAHNNLGIAFASKGLLDQSIEQFRKALEIDADYRDARNNLDIVLKQRQKNR